MSGARDLANGSPPVDNLSHMSRGSVVFVLAAAGLASACGGADIEILELAANPASVPPGRPTTIVYKVAGADTAEIVEEGGGPLLAPTSVLSGSVATPPISAPTVYVLRARRGEALAERSITVLVDTLSATIDGFEATPSRVERGVPITLSWRSTNAARGELRLGGVKLLDIAPGALAEGSAVVAPIDRPGVFTLAITSPGGFEITRDAAVAFDGPYINVFAAEPNPVRRGRAATLSWSAEQATRVLISGNLSGAIAAETAASGTVEVSPRFNELYTLVATDASARTASASVNVTVSVPRNAEVLSFSATPEAVDLGQPSTLAWEVANAPGGVEISEAGRVLTSTAAEVGTFSVYPTASTIYTLRAINQGARDASEEVTVTVNETLPTIVSLLATPNPAPSNTRVTVSFQTAGATSSRLLQGTVELVSTRDPSATYLLDVAGEAIDLVLEASNSFGTRTEALRIDVHGPPRILQFESTPRSVLGQGAVNIAYSALDVNRLSLFANGAPVAGFPIVDNGRLALPASGVFAVNVARTTTFELLAESAAGSASASILVSQVSLEVEPNDGPQSAMPVSGDGSGVSARIDLGGDADWYAVTVLPGQGLFAETSNGAGGCTIDTVMAMYAPDGTTELVVDDDDGPPITGDFVACSRIDWRADAAARNLAAGTYFLRVTHYAAGTGPYTLTVSMVDPGCGDGYVEDFGPGVSEQCDDGNTTSGDGCSATCAVEPLAIVPGPNVARTLGGSISAPNEVDYYRLDLLGAGYVRAESFAPAAPSCSGADTVLRLYDETFGELGSNDQDGVESCSAIEPAASAWAAVGPGTYWLSIEDFGRDDPISAYTIELTLIGAGCGNTFLEAPEGCDDGNNVPGDGCDAQCSPEGVPELESLGNDLATGPGVVTSAQSVVFSGSLFPPADTDYWAVVVPEGHHLEAWLTNRGLDDCAPEPTPHGRLTLLAPDAVTQLAQSATDPEGSACARISPRSTPAAQVLAAGTYFLRVDEAGGAASLATYFLHVDLVAPGCGNGIREAGEQCDDGGLAAGDGCGPTCVFEVRPGVIVPPNGTALLTLAAGGLSVVEVRTTVAGQSISAIAADPGGATCNGIRTRIEVYDASGARVGGAVANGPIGAQGECAAIRFPEDRWASDLSSGTYYLVVYDESAAAGTTELRVAFHDPACGDGTATSRSGEQCDDGNTSSGDGCSAACGFEALASAVLPTTQPVVLSGALSPVGNVDAYTITVTGGDAYLIAETFAPDVASGCAGADTILSLYDAGSQRVGADDDGGGGACSRISWIDPWARLTPGTYVLTVEDAGGDQELPAYQLVVEGLRADICGNGVREGAEACDDPSPAAGGCSPACVFEGTPPIAEVEPNGTALIAQDLGTVIPPVVLELAFAIDSEGDEDWFTFTIPGVLPALTGGATHGRAGELASCGFDTELWLYDGVPSNLAVEVPGGGEPALLAYDDDDGFGDCSELEGTHELPGFISLSPGTYWVRLRSGNPSSVISQYFTTLDLR